MEISISAEVYYEEADELLSRGDLVQACEKYYKAAEEAVKLLVVENDLKEVIKEVQTKGRWDAENLFKASRLLRSRDPRVTNWWRSAWVLHVDGFHEMSLSEKEVRKLKEDVRELVAYVTGK